MSWSTVQCTFKKKDCIDQPNSTKRPEGPQKTTKEDNEELKISWIGPSVRHNQYLPEIWVCLVCPASSPPPDPT